MGAPAAAPIFIPTCPSSCAGRYSRSRPSAGAVTTMTQAIDDKAMDALFREARSHNAWLDRPVADETLRQIYDVMKWGPTSANAMPARIVFLRTAKAKERLRPALAAGNIEKTMAAPVTAIIAYDLKFYEKLPKLFPQSAAMRNLFASNPDLVTTTARR